MVESVIFLSRGLFSSSVYSSHGAGKVSEQARSKNTFLDTFFPGHCWPGEIEARWEKHGGDSGGKSGEG